MKKIIIITISILLVLTGALFVYAFFDSRESDRTVTESIRNIFPQSETNDTGKGARQPEDINTTNNNPDNNVSVGQNNFLDNLSSERTDRLVKISNNPVSGAGFASTSTIRYIDKGTGNIYEYQFFTENSRKITNTTIPTIHDSYWINSDAFVARYLDDDNETIKTFIGTINNPGDNGNVTTNFLPDNIKSISVKDQSTIAFVYDDLVNSIIAVHNVETAETTIVTEIPTPEMNIFWMGETLYSYPYSSNGVAGTLFRINIPTGQFQYEIGPVEGMLASAISENDILVSSYGSSNQSFLYNIDSKEINILNSTVIPEKCTSGLTKTLCAGFSNTNNTLPDNWYKGIVSFNDNIHLLSDTGFATDYILPINIDIINPEVSPDETSLLFTNKKDQSLWLLDLE